MLKALGLQLYRSDCNYENIKLYKDTVERFFQNKIEFNITNLILGNEFCEKLLPAIDEVRAFIDLCKSLSVMPTLITPPVTDEGIRYINNIVGILDDSQCEYEIIVNDVGVLQSINSTYSHAHISLGRILDKTSREGREDVESLKEYYGIGIDYAREASLYGKWFSPIVLEYGINSIGFDISPIGCVGNNNQIKKDLYVPWTYTTTGRVCFWNIYENNDKDPFLVGKACEKKCINKHAILDNGKIKRMFIQKWNTIFYRNTIEEILCVVGDYDRIIFSDLIASSI